MMPSTWDLIATLRSDCTLPIDSITRGTSCRTATATCTGTGAAAAAVEAPSRLQPASAAVAASSRKKLRRQGELMAGLRGLRTGLHAKEIGLDVQEFIEQRRLPRRRNAAHVVAAQLCRDVPQPA